MGSSVPFRTFAPPKGHNGAHQDEYPSTGERIQDPSLHQQPSMKHEQLGVGCGVQGGPRNSRSLSINWVLLSFAPIRMLAWYKSESLRPTPKRIPFLGSLLFSSCQSVYESKHPFAEDTRGVKPPLLKEGEVNWRRKNIMASGRAFSTTAPLPLHRYHLVCAAPPFWVR